MYVDDVSLLGFLHVRQKLTYILKVTLPVKKVSDFLQCTSEEDIKKNRVYENIEGFIQVNIYIYVYVLV